MKEIVIECNHESGFPEWGNEAFSIFTNRHGEQWLAAWRGTDLVISSGDIDWADIVIPDSYLQHYPKRMPAALISVVFNDEEKQWLRSVLLVGAALAEAKTEGR